MELCFDREKASGYKSPSQKARVLTEDWGTKNLFCVSCKQNKLSHAHDNTRVIDFICERCKETYQLKSQSIPLGSKVLDSAYGPMISFIKQNKAPNLVLMHYDRKDYCVENLLLVPRYFLTPSCIERRKPLSLTARRSGWVGCNILLSGLPADGRITLIRDRQFVGYGQARRGYDRFRFLSEKRYDVRGWMADVLKVIRDLGKREFTLDEIFAFEPRLQKLHPENRNIRPKIRQQLQFLRDRGVLAFQGRGRYEIKS
jgi:type II restriction enzyme